MTAKPIKTPELQYPVIMFLILRFIQLERFSIECRKTKTKVITPTNHNRRKQHNGPMRTRSKNM